MMGDYARLAADAGARIIGGCCGTTPAHIKAMGDALQGYCPKRPPTHQEIETRFGPLMLY
jgi:5-methyltetrahydrofolate--homocysteine methyltransferase